MNSSHGLYVFRKFEEYISEKEPKNLNDIIKDFSNRAAIKKDWRYFFIKFPSVIEYCKEGNFLWEEDGGLIYLLESEKNTLYKAKEIYTQVFQEYFEDNYKLPTFSTNEYLYLRIDFNDNEYYVTEDYNATKFELQIWSNGENALEHCLAIFINGNSKAAKLLEELKWQKNNEGTFERFGNPKLTTLGKDYEENLSNSVEAIIKLLKNGLGIKLV